MFKNIVYNVGEYEKIPLVVLQLVITMLVIITRNKLKTQIDDICMNSEVAEFERVIKVVKRIY